MKYLNTILVCFCALLFSCSVSKDVVATIDGKNIYLSEIVQNINETTFNELNPEKKRAFVRKYAIHKILKKKPTRELEERGLFIVDEENRFKNNLIVQKVENYISDQFVFTDSILEYVSEAIKLDAYVKGITVSHAFSFGKANERTKEEAYQRAETIYNRIISGELSYEAALSIYSESSISKIKGNEMGQLYYGLMTKNFNDVVWSSPESKLHKPLETPIGFHVVIVENIIPKAVNNNKEIDWNKLKRELQKGKYGFIEENFSKFIDGLYQKYDVAIEEVELYNLWYVVQEIEGVKSMSGVPVSSLKSNNYNSVLGKIGETKLTMDWFLDKSDEFSFYSNVAINNGFSFKKLISDVMARYLMVLWYEDNKKLFPGLEITMKENNVNKIYSLFLDKMLEQNPELTQDIILNQFMVNEEIIINNALFVEDSP